MIWHLLNMNIHELHLQNEVIQLKVPLQVTKALGGERYSSYSFLTSALDGVSGQRHAPAALYPGERTPGTHCTGSWVSLAADLDIKARRKVLSPLLGIEPRSPGRPDRSQTLY
jgi:hypothetical protein